VAVETYNYELQLALVAQNRGLSLVPERILNRSRQRSRLRVLRVPRLEFPLVVWVVCREPLAGFTRVVAELLRTFHKKCKTRFKKRWKRVRVYFYYSWAG
jgi:DNA-binding transcriptional LysR family regulator